MKKKSKTHTPCAREIEEKGLQSLYREQQRMERRRQRWDAMMERRKVFWQQVSPYAARYGAETVRQFFLYWACPNVSKCKMRHELKHYWDFESAIQRWVYYDQYYYGRRTPHPRGNQLTTEQAEAARCEEEARRQQREQAYEEARRTKVTYEEYRRLRAAGLIDGIDP